MLKKILGSFILLLVILIIGALVVMNIVISDQKVKTLIEESITTDEYRLDMGERFELSFFPDLGIVAEGLTLNKGNKSVLQVGKIDIGVDWFNLLFDRKISIEKALLAAVRYYPNKRNISFAKIQGQFTIDLGFTNQQNIFHLQAKKHHVKDIVLDGEVSFDQLAIDKYKIDKGSSNISLVDGDITFSAGEYSLYDGNANLVLGISNLFDASKSIKVTINSFVDKINVSKLYDLHIVRPEKLFGSLYSKINANFFLDRDYFYKGGKGDIYVELRNVGITNFRLENFLRKQQLRSVSSLMNAHKVQPIKFSRFVVVADVVDDSLEVDKIDIMGNGFRLSEGKGNNSIVNTYIDQEVDLYICNLLTKKVLDKDCNRYKLPIYLKGKFPNITAKYNIDHLVKEIIGDPKKIENFMQDLLNR